MVQPVTPLNRAEAIYHPFYLLRNNLEKKINNFFISQSSGIIICRNNETVVFVLCINSCYDWGGLILTAEVLAVISEVSKVKIWRVFYQIDQL